ncbi:MAG: helix-turn-helix transcriptional regulator [Muribaculaceae bacterium]
MKPQYPENTTGVTDWKDSVGRPVRTDGCIFFLCTAGMAAVSVNMQKRPLRRGDLLVLTSDMFMSVEAVSSGFSADYISLSGIMLETAYYKISDISLWDYLHFTPIIPLNVRQQSLMGGWIAQVGWILDNMPSTNRITMLGYMVYNLFVAIDAEFAKTDIEARMEYKNNARDIINKFWSLLMKNSPNEKEVRFYADALSITPDYLYKVCRRIYGISPKALIDQQLAVEIKTLMSDTEMTVREIADRLCFEDDSYMCRFFRRATGLSPIQFRLHTKLSQRAK